MKKTLWFLSGFSIAMILVNFEILPFTAFMVGITLITELFVPNK